MGLIIESLEDLNDECLALEGIELCEQTCTVLIGRPYIPGPIKKEFFANAGLHGRDIARMQVDGSFGRATGFAVVNPAPFAAGFYWNDVSSLSETDCDFLTQCNTDLTKALYRAYKAFDVPASLFESYNLSEADTSRLLAAEAKRQRKAAKFKSHRS